MVESFTKVFSIDNITSALRMLEGEFLKLKEPMLSSLKEIPSVKEREKIWEKVREMFLDILLPMITIVNSNLGQEKEDRSDDISPNIGIVSRKNAEDAITIKTRLVAPNSNKSLVYRSTICDSGSDTSLISKNVVKRLDMEIDKEKKPEIGGVATKINSIGTVYGLGIEVYDNENSHTIEEDFLVINSDKDFVLLGTPWLVRSGSIIDCGKQLMRIPISSRKSITIPLSVRKRKNDSISLNLDTDDLFKKK